MGSSGRRAQKDGCSPGSGAPPGSAGVAAAAPGTPPGARARPGTRPRPADAPVREGGVPAGAPDDGEAEGDHVARDRLFVAVWPPEEVVAVLGAFPRPEMRGLRWTTADQWHVTLLFLGSVPGSEVEGVKTALGAAVAGAAGRPEARLGPSTVGYGRSVLGVPVAGLDGMAELVRAALGSPRAEGERPFDGHLTLARARGGRPVPASLAGAALAARWSVAEVCLVLSELDARGARYTTLSSATVPS